MPTKKTEAETKAVEEKNPADKPEVTELEKSADPPADPEVPPIKEDEKTDLSEGQQLAEALGAGDEMVGIVDVPVEELPPQVTLPGEVKQALEDHYPSLREHGSHKAAVNGLQTDADPGYRHPNSV